MEYNNIKYMTTFENQFWLQVLGDHSRFILNGLSPKEGDRIKQAEMFINLFDNLLRKSTQNLSDEDIKILNNDIYMAVMKLRAFKLDIISNQINGNISICLPCYLINHMVNELDEYLLILNALSKQNFSNARPIYLHLLWLPNASQHANFIGSNVDMTEEQLIEEMRKYSKTFNKLSSKAMNYKGYMRTGIDDFSAFQKFNLDVNEVMKNFKDMLNELTEYVAQKKVISTLPPLAYNHMFREECYYLLKLSLVSNIEKPNCDPTKSLVEV